MQIRVYYYTSISCLLFSKQLFNILIPSTLCIYIPIPYFLFFLFIHVFNLFIYLFIHYLVSFLGEERIL